MIVRIIELYMINMSNLTGSALNCFLKFRKYIKRNVYLSFIIFIEIFYSAQNADQSILRRMQISLFCAEYRSVYYAQNADQSILRRMQISLFCAECRSVYSVQNADQSILRRMQISLFWAECRSVYILRRMQISLFCAECRSV